MQAIQNIAILVNSKSGGGKSLRVLQHIKSIIEFEEISFCVYIDQWQNNLSNFTAIWIIGGDGTLNYFINKYPTIKTPIALFKGGTGNDFAWKLYGNISLDAQVNMALKNHSITVDAGLCNNKVFINGIGIGFDGEVLKNMKSIRWLGGHLGYLIIVIGKILRFKENNFKITTNGTSIEKKLFLMSVFNSSRTGGGFYIAPNAIIDDGLLNVIQCQPLSVVNRLKNLPKIEKGQHLNLPFINHSLQKKIIIECANELPAQIDGELFFAKDFRIEILPNQFNFLC